MIISTFLGFIFGMVIAGDPVGGFLGAIIAFLINSFTNDMTDTFNITFKFKEKKDESKTRTIYEHVRGTETRSESKRYYRA